MATIRSLIWLCVLVAAMVCIGACSKSSGPPKKVCYPVKGQLFVKSQPATGATVIFHPRGSGPEEWTSGYPRAHVAADGTFELETYGDKDGAPAGDYTVVVTWPRGAADEQSEDTQMIDRLGGRYSDPATSKLQATVNSSPTEVPPIRLP
jgi:hypothetical protein